MKIRCMNCMKEYSDTLEQCPECGFVRHTPPKEIYHLHTEVVLAERYVLGTVIAYGGFGILYRAWDEKLQIMVAVKEYFPSSYVNRNPGEKEIFIYTSKKQGEFKAGLEGFLDEARNTAKFSSHPNIVNVFDYFQENQTAYMVMEYMDGITMKQYVKEQGGKIGWEKAVEILASICDDLQVVHEAGILHRDISPDNIMLCKDGAIKLFDFGAARFSDSSQEVTRTIILKVGFAPPEQYRAKSKQGPWTDIYALGATLYRTITGVLPDESVNRQEALLKEKKDTLIKPGELVEDLPPYLDTAICRAMAIQPELRFKDARQFKAALLNEKEYQSIEEELKRRKKRRKIGICAILSVLVIGIAGCIGYYRNLQTETTLDGARIQIWVPVAGGEEEAKATLLTSMMEEFQSDYPGVEVDVAYIPETEYKERLLQASETEAGFPTLYESGELGSELDGRRGELSEVLALLEPEDYYCLDYVAQGEDGVRRIPLGMHMAVIYGNSQQLRLNEDFPEGNDEEVFLTGNSAMWLGDSRDYIKVQAGLPGVYQMMPLRKEPVLMGFDQIWSVDKEAKKLNQEAAKRLLYYFLGETAQDILHLQNDNALPLNKEEFSVYLDVNQELAFLKDQLEAGGPILFLEEEAYREQLAATYASLMTDDQAMDEIREWQNEGDK